MTKLGAWRPAVKRRFRSRFATPVARKSYPRRSPAIGPWMAVIDEWLVADKNVPRKQRHTARRIWQRLGAEHGAVVSETVRIQGRSTARVPGGLAAAPETDLGVSHGITLIGVAQDRLGARAVDLPWIRTVSF